VGAVVQPLYLTTKFEMGLPERAARLFSGKREGFIYTRLGNPTTALLERKVASLEGGEAAVAFASGIGAITAVILDNVKAGERMCVAAQVYSGTTYFLNSISPRLNIAVDFVDGTNSEAIADDIIADLDQALAVC
jgi:methionine-gamma-lyase